MGVDSRNLPPEARTFASPDLNRLLAVRSAPRRPNQKFEPLPAPTGPPPYRFGLETVIGPTGVARVREGKKLVFHCMGDTGGVKHGAAQQIVANHMISDLADSTSPQAPVFFYHLGDVVYYYGEAAEYYGQFYEPYDLYPAPILAIPGNHDGAVIPRSGGTSLDAFVRNFCANSPQPTEESGDSHRDAMTLPNVYWTLEAPYVTIVGLYTNVPEGGEVDDGQKAWLVKELSDAAPDKALILAMHHPLLSLDAYHSGSAAMHDLLDTAAQTSGRVPDLVLTGHVHNYQRFTRAWQNKQVPVIVAGAGGYWNLHYMSHSLGWPIRLPFAVPADAANGMQATLEAFVDNSHGYLVLEVDNAAIRGTYFTVPRPQEPWRAGAAAADAFSVDLASHKTKPGRARRSGRGGLTGIGPPLKHPGP